MKQNVFITVLLLFLASSLFAQRNCGSMEYLQYQEDNDPKRTNKLKIIENHTQDVLQQNFKTVNGIITIPVVVHVLYNNSTENISNAQIQSQLDVMNADFRRQNSDADNSWAQAADTEIEFCMATADPNGNNTDGITRTSTSVTSFSTNDNMKFNSSGGKDAWPASDYLNMWVCDISGGILGYAQFPGGAASTDGVVMDYQYFGTIGTATSPFDLGRTTTHEVGHWLNLRHIWGDGGCSVDDFVSDTPTSDNPNYGCAIGHVSCSTTDMVQNYMDYSDDACMNLYTQGQTDRMRAIFEPGGFRASLLSSTACGPPAAPTCTDGVQNGNETGVDCGGPDCSACPTCHNVTLSINLDNYPEETSWSITNSGSSVVASGGTYGNQSDGSNVTVVNCLIDGCYDFTINDSYGDGICCSYGSGSYTLTDNNGNVVASGGAFSSSETTNFCVSGGVDPCENNGGDADNDGVCADVDCNDNNASIGAQQSPGTTCNDGDANTVNDVIQSDGCTCAGTFDPCASSGGDSDNDGVCANNDCNDNDASVGAQQTPGTSCNDGNSATINDVIQSDGCTCAGTTPQSCNTPSGLSATTTSVDASLTWNLNGAVGYNVRARQVGTSTWTTGNNLNPPVNYTGLTSCTDYEFQVQANCSGSTSAWSSSNSFATTGCGGGCSYVSVDFNNFDSSWGIWNDGGSDCRRSSNDAAYAYSGSRCVRIRDNSSSSVTTTDNLNLSAYDEITIDFTYYPRSMDNSNEDFWLQVSTNGGSSYTTVEEWNKDDEFVNNVRYFDQVIIPGPFTSTTRFRFRCDASGNPDYIYLDDVSITGCLNSAREGIVAEETLIEDIEMESIILNEEVEMSIYPNPTSNEFYVNFDAPQKEKGQLMIFDITGKVVYNKELNVREGLNTISLNSQEYNSGTYIVHMIMGNAILTERLIIQR